jgi:chemosensory pili system protein ChpA (sensor histidine kinase/response regulator)
MQIALAEPVCLDTLEQASDASLHRILIADDDLVVRGSLAAVLESEGYAVDEARNGIEAVTRCIQHLPDLVLLDLNMPHWDGWTTFSQLDRVKPLLPVIVITARPNQYEKAVRLGVDAFMEKPLNIAVLVRAIKRLTIEDNNRHVRRITNPGFVTELLLNADE